MIKSKTMGRDYGIVLVAEGVAELMVDELKEHPFVLVKYDKHRHLRLARSPLWIDPVTTIAAASQRTR